ncbi:MAG: NAD(+) synthase [Thermoguttaceae bacterium]
MIFATATLNQTPLDWSGNFERISRAIDIAKRQGAGLLCLPELSLTGIGCQNHFKRPAVLQQARSSLLQLLDQTENITVAIGLPWNHNGKIYNAAALLTQGQIVGIQCKTRLSINPFPELYWFSRWTPDRQDTVEINGQLVPIGDFPFLPIKRSPFSSTKDLTVRLEIGNIPEQGKSEKESKQNGQVLCNSEVDVILHLGGSPFTFGQHEERQTFFKEQTAQTNSVYLFANQLGNEVSPIIYDGGATIAELGQILAETPRFSFQDVQVVCKEQQLVEQEGRCGQDARVPVGIQSISNHLPFNREEELLRSVSLALFDYLRKTRANGFVLSLSGGADSAALAVFVHFLVRLGVAELGLKPFWNKITNNAVLKNSFLAESAQSGVVRESLANQDVNVPKTEMPKTELDITESDMVARLLTCLYQKSENSSETTFHAAQSLAKGLGATFHSVDIAGIIAAYTDLIGPLLDRSIGWGTDDLALQNIQARVRGPSVWFLANLKNALLLCTSNRSEATVGYATLDGDTCGGLSPIGGIDKHYLRSWLRWIESIGPEIDGQRFPIPSLHQVNQQVPTAELRPQEETQTDEADLMPYEVLEQIEQYAVYARHTPNETLTHLGLLYPNEDRATLQIWVDRFFSLWSRNQWKQQRYALSFHLDRRCGNPGENRLYPNVIGPNGLE